MKQKKEFFVLIITLNVLFIFLFLSLFWVYQRFITIEEIRTNNLITPKIEIKNNDTIYIYRDYSH